MQRRTCSPAMESMACTSVRQGPGRGRPRARAHSAHTAPSVLSASARWCSCTAAVFSNVFFKSPPPPQYSSGTSLPAMRGNVLYACPASSPATNAPANHELLSTSTPATLSSEQGGQHPCIALHALTVAAN